MIKLIFQIFVIFLPWKIRRVFLHIVGINAHKTAHVGFSLISAHTVELKAYSRIGNFTFCKCIDKLILGENSNIGNFNYITGFSVNHPAVNKYGHFKSVSNRKCELIIGKHSGITSRHYFDCNGGIYIGDFVQIAGMNSLFLTHSIDLQHCYQDAKPIVIGDYCFIGTSCTILKGCIISKKITVAACSLVNKSLEISNSLYGGVPAKLLKKDTNYKFYNRKDGFVI